MSSPDYLSRVEREIEHYRRVENIHDLPDIYHFWAKEFLLPKMQQVLGTGSEILFYANTIAEQSKNEPGSTNFLSIGAGDAVIETAIVQELLAMNVENFHIICLEISPALIERATTRIDAEGLSQWISFTQGDVNHWIASEPESFDGVIANQFLHHIVELEFVFEQVERALKPDGLFMTIDLIGRNGHMRWPEAMAIINPIWASLEKRYKYNHQMKRVDEEFVNWDCSTEGFEGIRAQDILPLLVDRFNFKVFLGFGNLTDIFVDRGYGHNYDPVSEKDRNFISALATRNDYLIDTGFLKPTMMFAQMGKGSYNTRTFKHWTPEFCIRDTSSTT